MIRKVAEDDSALSMLSKSRSRSRDDQMQFMRMLFDAGVDACPIYGFKVFDPDVAPSAGKFLQTLASAIRDHSNAGLAKQATDEFKQVIDELKAKRA